MAAPDGKPAAPTPAGSGRFLRSGKVRDLYRLADGRIVLVASDRISAFDVVLPSLIPDKGRVLTGVSRYWFAQTGHIIANHLLSADPAELAAEADDAARTELRGRIMVCRPTTVLPIEAVVRGYLAGSGWKDYLASGEVCGHRLPGGLVESAQLPEPLFTPATKAQTGHDENIDGATAAALVGEERYAEVARLSLDLYRTVSERAAALGIILADTKLEFGVDAEGRLVGRAVLRFDVRSDLVRFLRSFRPLRRA